MLSGHVSFEVAKSADPAEIAELIEQLADVDAVKRDSAAQRLREIDTAPGRAIWDSMLAKIRPGDQRSDILQIFGIATAEPEVVMGSGPYQIESYRLDRRWMLTGTFLNENQGVRANTLHSNAGISETWQAVHVNPPVDFPGKWTTYYANGHPQSERHFDNGNLAQRFGTTQMGRFKRLKTTTQHPLHENSVPVEEDNTSLDQASNRRDQEWSETGNGLQARLISRRQRDHREADTLARSVSGAA